MASTPAGYYLVASDGGLFTFGDAAFHGSVPGLGTRVSDVVGVATGGADYYVAARDGKVYRFG